MTYHQDLRHRYPSLVVSLPTGTSHYAHLGLAVGNSWFIALCTLRVDLHMKNTPGIYPSQSLFDYPLECRDELNDSSVRYLGTECKRYERVHLSLDEIF